MPRYDNKAVREEIALGWTPKEVLVHYDAPGAHSPHARVIVAAGLELLQAQLDAEDAALRDAESEDEARAPRPWWALWNWPRPWMMKDMAWRMTDEERAVERAKYASESPECGDLFDMLCAEVDAERGPRYR